MRLKPLYGWLSQFISKNHRPPTRTSISKTSSSGERRLISAASEMARKTRSGGAAMSISEIMVSWSGVTMVLGITSPIERPILFTALQREQFLHLFAVIEEGPLFCVVIGVGHGEDDVLHVTSVEAGEIGCVNKVERDTLAVG